MIVDGKQRKGDGIMKTVKRLDLFLWFGGECSLTDIKEEVRTLFQLKGLKPLHAEYGIVEVPEEDVGECPWDYLSSAPTTKEEIE